MRNQKCIDKISEISEYLPRNSHGTTAVPIDLKKLLKRYDLSLKSATFKRPGISGAFDRDARTIYINTNEPYTRQMFTIAHELGHYFLHSHLAEDIIYREKNETKNRPEETEADAFAAELLMPEDTIRLYWPIAESIQQLADIFGVSFSAMSVRLRTLGYI